VAATRRTQAELLRRLMGGMFTLTVL
jgi:hypothetical protein